MSAVYHFVVMIRIFNLMCHVFKSLRTGDRGQGTEKRKREGCNETNPRPGMARTGVCCINNSAATYSPTQLPAQYHRRWRA
jgi:hypothetical protein